jgi:hypothetical protein
MGEDRKCERCWGSGRIVQASSHGARMNACPNCGGSGIDLAVGCAASTAGGGPDLDYPAPAPAPAVPEEGERWRVLRDDEDLGPGCYEVGIEGYGPPPGDAILVPASRAEAAERHLAELREEVERVRDFCEDDRVLSMNTMGEKSGAAIAYGIVIERLDAALHPQDSTERTEHG